MKYDLIISGRSSGGTDTIGRVLRVLRSKPNSPVKVLIEEGDKQQAILDKLKKDYNLVASVTSYQMQVEISLERDDGLLHPTFLIEAYNPNKGLT